MAIHGRSHKVCRLGSGARVVVGFVRSVKDPLFDVGVNPPVAIYDLRHPEINGDVVAICDVREPCLSVDLDWKRVDSPLSNVQMMGGILSGGSSTDGIVTWGNEPSTIRIEATGQNWIGGQTVNIDNEPVEVGGTLQAMQRIDIIGGSYGAGNYAMCGRAYGARMMWTWPNARISVMGGEQAAHVLATVREEGLSARGEAWNDEDKNEFMDGIRASYETEGTPYFASARLWDDGVIDPADTRRVLSLALAFSTREPEQPRSGFGIFRM